MLKGAHNFHHSQFKCQDHLLRITYYYTYYFISSRFLFLYPAVFCRGTDIILISSQFQCYSWGAISLARYARYMQTYVLFQYSILCNIVSKTSESLIRRVVNLAYFRFTYISHPVAVYMPCVIYTYISQRSLFRYSLNNVSSINSETLLKSQCCSSSRTEEIRYFSTAFFIRIFLFLNVY